ncbi:hypothetical protein KAFR_0B05820 [Kazachstania africana CBS 2517]|uniref:DNA-directed RNA polymerase I subunit RPA14 n=1 Tax=Kazachstania africana (strain ATCC 22294 / BCRC 22015 / CBS 2517 / CECT 1963 / NBRC 1671 / NRRL Y-8276) TaxID=1071382 RepID=H2AR78_KAZAF|nr:hypothetical protein KAFR_0B05820 [Kazachstania africana CBS 2517]CCF56878.1 hypothetical protein KAFR_0B05820 [Kazachstania africana CBS 2517]
MMKGSRRPGNVYATPLNTPITIHKSQRPQHVSKDEVLNFLETFITEKESILNNQSNFDDVTGNTSSTAGTIINIDTTLTSSLSQLKRLQRDFKGLPPATFESPSPSTTTPVTVTVTETGDSITKSATGGTKMKFSDE